MPSSRYNYLLNRHEYKAGIYSEQASNWWLASTLDESHVVAAYQFADAPSEAIALQDKVNSYHLYKIGNPIWNISKGFLFPYCNNVACGLHNLNINSSSYVTAIIRYKNRLSSSYVNQIMGTRSIYLNCAIDGYSTVTITNYPGFNFINNGNSNKIVSGAAPDNGIITVNFTDSKFYLDAIEKSVSSPSQVYIQYDNSYLFGHVASIVNGHTNSWGSVDEFGGFTVVACALYNIVLSTVQISEITTRMNSIITY